MADDPRIIHIEADGEPAHLLNEADDNTLGLEEEGRLLKEPGVG